VGSAEKERFVALALRTNPFRKNGRIAERLIGEDPDLAAWLNSLPAHHRDHVLAVTENDPKWWHAELTGDDAELTRASLASGFWLIDVAAERERLRGSGSSVTESMGRIIDMCAKLKPHPDWPAFAALDYESDVRHLGTWLDQTFRVSEPPAATTGLWFGLFNPVENEEPTADLYLAGGHAEPDDADWLYDLDWRPGGRAHSVVLDAIYRLSYPPGLLTSASSEAEKSAYESEAAKKLGNDAEYNLCLAYGVFAIEALAEGDRAATLSHGGVERRIAVGFDSGDFVVLGSSSVGGFARKSR